jgi:hypothetical protein
MSVISSISSAKKCRRTLQNFKTSKVKFNYINGELRSACDCNEIIPPEVRQQNRILGNVYHDMCEQMVEHAKIELYRQIPDPSYPEGTRIEVEFVSNQVCDIKTENNYSSEIDNLTESFSPIIVKSINVPEWFDSEKGIILVPTLVSDRQSNDSNLRLMTVTGGNSADTNICVQMSYILKFYALYYDTTTQTWRRLGRFFGSPFSFPMLRGDLWVRVQGQPYQIPVPQEDFSGLGRTGVIGPQICGYYDVDFIDKLDVDVEKTQLSIDPYWADNPCWQFPCEYSFPRNLKVRLIDGTLFNSLRINQRAF